MAIFSVITLFATSILAAIIDTRTPATEGVAVTPYVEEAAAAPRVRPSAITLAPEHHERITSEVVKPLQERPRLEMMSRIALPREHHVSYALTARSSTRSAWQPFAIREEAIDRPLFGDAPDDGRYRFRVQAPAITGTEAPQRGVPQRAYTLLADGRIHTESGEIQLRLRDTPQDAWLSTREALPRLRLLR
jgi:hypothetical protein